MTKFKNANMLFIFVILTFFSCNDPNEYRVDDAFSDYLQRFEMAAAKHNRYFDLEQDGLIIEFADLKDNKAGLTHYENPVRIEIDKKYWYAISKYVGADLMRENLIFHELGHGLLKRSHLNTTLQNGDWKSIMCGGERVDNRSWNINYKGMRRNYYIDELFDENTPSPEFSSTQLKQDTTGFSPALVLSFNSESESGWDLLNDSQRKMSIDNGRLRFRSLVSDSYLVLISTNISVQSDFSFGLTIQFPVINNIRQYGLAFGYIPQGSTGTTDPLEYFTVTNNKKMIMGNRSWYSFFTELNVPAIIPGVENAMKVFKIGHMLYYFINNVYCYCSEMETKESGNVFGFIVPPEAEVWVDNFVISQRRTSKSAARAFSKQTIEFKMIRSEFKSNEIKTGN